MSLTEAVTRTSASGEHQALDQGAQPESDLREVVYVRIMKGVGGVAVGSVGTLKPVVERDRFQLVVEVPDGRELKQVEVAGGLYMVIDDEQSQPKMVIPQQIDEGRSIRLRLDEPSEPIKNLGAYQV